MQFKHQIILLKNKFYPSFHSYHDSHIFAGEKLIIMLQMGYYK